MREVRAGILEAQKENEKKPVGCANESTKLSFIMGMIILHNRLSKILWTNKEHNNGTRGDRK